MKSFMRSVSGGFGRVLGRFLFYIMIGYLAYFIIQKLGINIGDYIPNIRKWILWKKYNLSYLF